MVIKQISVLLKNVPGQLADLSELLGKEGVNITSIEPQGQYALRLSFDDGHDTGIYSWDTLYKLGVNQEQNWRRYLERLEALGYSRQVPAAEAGKRKVRLLYFTYLVQKMRTKLDQLEDQRG